MVGWARGGARQVLAYPPGPVDLTAHPQLRFRVRFADGRSAVQDDETWLRKAFSCQFCMPHPPPRHCR
jgi:hypothetical protein